MKSPLLSSVRLLFLPFSAPAARVVIPLDGPRAVEEGVAPDAVPAVFAHEVPVPGLTRQAPTGLASCRIEVPTPACEGRFVLMAGASWPGQPFSPVISRRQVSLGQTASPQPEAPP